MNSMDKRQASSTTPPPIYQTILMDGAVEFSIEALKSDIQAVFGAQDLEITSSSPDALIITWSAFAFTVVNIDRPAPLDLFEDALTYSASNDPIRTAVAQHQTHLIISTLKSPEDMGQSVMMSVILMMLSQVITFGKSEGAKNPQPLAYLWNLSQTLLCREDYDRAVIACNDALAKKKTGQANAGSSLPVHYWFGLRFYSADNNLVGVVTQGCIPYTGYEIQIDPIQWKASELASRVYGVGAYLFDHGPGLPEGHTLGISQNEQFGVSYKNDTESGHACMVLSLKN